MKPLIVVTSCARDKQRGYHDAIRATWGKASPIPYRFLLGIGNYEQADDELVFDDVIDDHAHCTYKTRAGHRWALQNGYDFVLQAFTDTYLNLPAILNSDFAQYGYTGFFKGTTGTYDYSVPDAHGWYGYASGGVGYWTNLNGTKALAEADIEEGLTSWAEDLWAGTALGRAGIYGHHDERYRLEATWFLDWFKARRIGADAIFSLHLGRGTGVYDPQWMYDAHSILEINK